MGTGKGDRTMEKMKVKEKVVFGRRVGGMEGVGTCRHTGNCDWGVHFH